MSRWVVRSHSEASGLIRTNPLLIYYVHSDTKIPQLLIMIRSEDKNVEYTRLNYILLLMVMYQSLHRIFQTGSLESLQCCYRVLYYIQALFDNVLHHEGRVFMHRCTDDA